MHSVMMWDVRNGRTRGPNLKGGYRNLQQTNNMRFNTDG